MKHLGLMAMGLFVAAGAWSRPAAACGACLCDDQPRSIITLLRDAPLNLEIPLRALDDDLVGPRLERVSDGMTVAASVERIPEGARSWWLKVDADLEPNTEYRIVGRVGTAQFTTGTARDEQAPTLEQVSATAGGNANLCNSSIGAQLKLSGADDNGPFAVWVELEVELEGRTENLFTDYNHGGIPLGHSTMGCFGDRELPGLVAGQSYAARVRLHDAAGQASEWLSVSVPVAAEEPGGCGSPTTTAGGTSSADPNERGGAGTSPSSPEGAKAPAAGSERTASACSLALGSPRELPSMGFGLMALASFVLIRRRPAGARRTSRTSGPNGQ